MKWLWKPRLVTLKMGQILDKKTEEIIMLNKEFVPYTKPTALIWVFFFSSLGRVKGMTVRDYEEIQKSLTLPTFIFTYMWPHSPFWGRYKTAKGCH